MDDTRNVGGRDRLVRLVLTAVLSIVAVRSLRRGDRLRGLLAGVGSLGLGFTATTGYCGVNDALGVDTTASGSEEVDISFEETEAEPASDPATAAESSVSTAASADADESHYLTCAVCGEPIVAGQARGPNSQGDIVHDSCE